MPIFDCLQGLAATKSISFVYNIESNATSDMSGNVRVNNVMRRTLSSAGRSVSAGVSKQRVSQPRASPQLRAGAQRSVTPQRSSSSPAPWANNNSRGTKRSVQAQPVRAASSAARPQQVRRGAAAVSVPQNRARQTTSLTRGVARSPAGGRSSMPAGKSPAKAGGGKFGKAQEVFGLAQGFGNAIQQFQSGNAAGGNVALGEATADLAKAGLQKAGPMGRFAEAVWSNTEKGVDWVQQNLAPDLGASKSVGEVAGQWKHVVDNIGWQKGGRMVVDGLKNDQRIYSDNMITKGAGFASRGLGHAIEGAYGVGKGAFNFLGGGKCAPWDGDCKRRNGIPV